MKTKDYSKILKRRMIWFERVAMRDEEIKLVKEKIDEYFEEEERKSAYAMTADIMTQSYPFETDRAPSDLVGIMREKYGLEVGDVYFIDDVLEEAKEIKTRETNESPAEEK